MSEEYEMDGLDLRPDSALQDNSDEDEDLSSEEFARELDEMMGDDDSTQTQERDSELDKFFEDLSSIEDMDDGGPIDDDEKFKSAFKDDISFEDLDLSSDDFAGELDEMLGDDDGPETQDEGDDELDTFFEDLNSIEDMEIDESHEMDEDLPDLPPIPDHLEDSGTASAAEAKSQTEITQIEKYKDLKPPRRLVAIACFLFTHTEINDDMLKELEESFRIVAQKTDSVKIANRYYAWQIFRSTVFRSIGKIVGKVFDKVVESIANSIGKIFTG